MDRAAMMEINLSAMEQMNTLHELLKSYGYTDKEREIFLVRLLLCYFSEDTGEWLNYTGSVRF